MSDHFDRYLFADYSGAERASVQRKCIRLAEASLNNAAKICEGRFTREALTDELVRRLVRATSVGERVCLGQDHQYGLPFDLLCEVGLDGLSWRESLAALRSGSYGVDAPALGAPRAFARAFNDWMVEQGRPPYFYSATKGALYGIPTTNPRSGGRTYRLTERPDIARGSPKPFNRLGDNGTVGGQTLVGLIQLGRLLELTSVEGLRVAVWPFDGLALSEAAYQNAHVLVEPYPTAVRAGDVVQSDESDALACANTVRQAVLQGTLRELLTVGATSPAQEQVILREGWIMGHRLAPERAG